MIHSSYYKPRIFAIKGDVADAEIDRAQTIDPTITLNREKAEEIGRVGAVGYIKKPPTIGYRMTQNEFGNIEFWQKLVNSATLGADGETAITLKDFKTPYFDICAYLTDDDDTFKGTVHYPTLRPSGFSLTIGDPEAVIERGFDFVGESAITWQGDNKYFIYNKHTCASGSDNVIDLSAKAPAEDPDDSGVYMLRVMRVTALGVTTELTRTTDYSYDDGAKELTIVSVTTGDVIKIYYTSATAPDVQFTPNTTDPAGLLADCASIYLYIPASGKPASTDYIHLLQSASIEVSFDREDKKEIGSPDVQQRGISDTTVSVSLGRILEDFTIEEVLRGVASGYGKIDVTKFSDQIALIIKIYSDNTKTTFKYGFLLTGLSPTELRGGAGVNAYVNKENSLEGEDLTISADATVIGI